MSIFKSEKIEKSLGVVLDVLFALVLLFSLFMTVSTLAQRENGVAGLRFGVIRSKSMEASELMSAASFSSIGKTNTTSAT